MTAYGTKLPKSRVRSSVANGGKADNDRPCVLARCLFSVARAGQPCPQAAWIVWHAVAAPSYVLVGTN
jgi:hypothetical protein